MASSNKKLFNPLYQTAVASEAISKGDPVQLVAPPGGVVADRVVAKCQYDSLVYGVAMDDAIQGGSLTLYKDGGSSEALVRAEHKTYLPGMRLGLSPNGIFDRIDLWYPQFWAYAIEAKTTSADDPLLKVVLLHGSDRGLAAANGGTGITRGRALKRDSQGGVGRFTAANDYVYAIAAHDNNVAEQEVLVYRRGFTTDALVRATGAATFAYGDLLKPDNNGSFEKTTTAGDKVWAAVIEGKTTTTSDLLLRVELIYDEV